jgi:hypothetical protein
VCSSIPASSLILLEPKEHRPKQYKQGIRLLYLLFRQREEASVTTNNGISLSCISCLGKKKESKENSLLPYVPKCSLLFFFYP